MPVTQKVDYGIDAPGALRNMCIAAIACLLVAFFAPHHIPIGKDGYFDLHKTTLITGTILSVECALWLLYVKYGKFRHRDLMLSLHTWRGDEQVLDIGCGRGLLLIGAAKQLATGHATGIDIWSNEDLSNNAQANTVQNLEREGVNDRCTLVSVKAEDQTFPSSSFDVILSNLCLHNIQGKGRRSYALNHIVRCLKPGGIALISDFKHTGEYADYFRRNGLQVNNKRGSFLTTFPPLNIIIARKPA